MFHVTHNFDGKVIESFHYLDNAVEFAKILLGTGEYRKWQGHTFHIWNNTNKVADKVNRFV